MSENLLGFQDNESFARSPQHIAAQTNILLDLIGKRTFEGSDTADFATGYLDKFTMPFLLEAIAGAYKIFIPNYADREHLKWNQAADFCQIIFGLLPDIAHPMLTNGFSRRGLMQPPQTREEFVGRIKEMMRVIHGVKESQEIPFHDVGIAPDIFRTRAFFTVAEKVPTHVVDVGRLSTEQLLKGIDIDL